MNEKPILLAEEALTSIPNKKTNYVSKKEREEMESNLIDEMERLRDSDDENDKMLLSMIEEEFQKKIDKFENMVKDMPRRVRRSLTPNNRFSARFKKRIGL